MASDALKERLVGIQAILSGVHRSGAGLTSATKGAERAVFLDGLLSAVLPAPFRFGTGDAIDQAGRRSGQLDVVVENAFCPSLPLAPGSPLRLYLAESIAAVIEVKSDIASQWDEVRRTAAALAPLRRELRGHSYVGQAPTSRIPFFAVGYSGWSKAETVESKLQGEAAPIDGVLVVEPGTYVAGPAFGGLRDSGPEALWAFICCLHRATNGIKQNTPDPYKYIQGEVSSAERELAPDGPLRGPQVK